MTFIDETAEKPSTFQVLCFTALVIISFTCCLIATRRGYSRRHYRNIFSISCLFPLCCFICALENATLAASGKIIENDGEAENLLYLKILFCIQSMEAPILLMVVFDLTYLANKNRSVNFCGMYFDEGHRVSKIITTPMKSFVLRNLIRVTGIFLLAMGIAVNFDITKGVKSVNDLAGKSGWWEFFKKDLNWSEEWHLFLSLLPTAILIVCSFYFSMILWRYGTTSSIVVYSTFVNPWFAPFFGTLGLTGGQLFGKRWYPLASNCGFLIWIISILLLMTEIDKDMVKSEELTDYLRQVSKKGDAISVRQVLEEYQLEEGNDDIISGDNTTFSGTMKENEMIETKADETQ